MPRQPRKLQSGYCYHITIRCNNREFCLYHRECREVLLYAINKAQQKFNFKLYGLCIMSNHVHYLLEPDPAHALPRLMHWLNWYTAMCFNRILNRTGHFWEKRYYSAGFERADYDRALNTLRYIHANPKAAKMQQGFFYDFSNYGSYNRLTDDGLTEWHPAFLELGTSLEECAQRYQSFCQRYTTHPKPEKQNPWGNRFLKGISKGKGKIASKKISPGQIVLPGWDEYQVSKHPEIQEVAERFITANAYSERKEDGDQ